MPESTEAQCRKCKTKFIPSFVNDFYEDGVDGPGTGLCESCMMNEVFNQPPKDLPTPEWVDTVCRKGQGPATCIFLVIPPAGESKVGAMFMCAKGSRMNNMIAERAQQGKMVARSCNCTGHPAFQPEATPIEIPVDEQPNGQ